MLKKKTVKQKNKNKKQNKRKSHFRVYLGSNPKLPTFRFATFHETKLSRKQKEKQGTAAQPSITPPCVRCLLLLRQII